MRVGMLLKDERGGCDCAAADGAPLSACLLCGLTRALELGLARCCGPGLIALACSEARALAATKTARKPAVVCAGHVYLPPQKAIHNVDVPSILLYLMSGRYTYINIRRLR